MPSPMFLLGMFSFVRDIITFLSSSSLEINQQLLCYLKSKTNNVHLVSKYLLSTTVPKHVSLFVQAKYATCFIVVTSIGTW